MKRGIFVLMLLSVLLTGCTAFKAIKCGDPSVDTYRHFALDTIKAGGKGESCLITADVYDRYFEDKKIQRRTVSQ